MSTLRERLAKPNRQVELVIRLKRAAALRALRVLAEEEDGHH